MTNVRGAEEIITLLKKIVIVNNYNFWLKGRVVLRQFFCSKLTESYKMQCKLKDDLCTKIDMDHFKIHEV